MAFDAGQVEQHAKMFGNRLQKRLKHLRRWAKRGGISCYRLYDRDIPEVPLKVDLYGDYIQVAWLAPVEVEDAEEHPWFERMQDELAARVGVSRDEIFAKVRQRQRGRNQYQRLADLKVTRIIREAGLLFEVNLSDHLDAGLFLDHRKTRAMVREESEGQRVLNLFAYTGSFTVYAAAGGARSSMTMDLSNNYVDWSRRNLQLNRLDGPSHEFLRCDVLQEMEGPFDEELFDIAVVDPPTFSTSKKMLSDWDVQKDHPWLLRKVAARMRPGGIIYFSSNYKRFKLDEDELVGMKIEEITRKTVPEDFARSKPHRCWRLICE